MALSLLGLLSVGLTSTVIVVVAVGLGMEKRLDRIRQAQLTAILKETVSTLNEHEVEYFLDYGTLLGFVRDNQVILGDMDFDITVVSHHRAASEHALMTNPKLQVFGKNRWMLRICLMGTSPIYVGDLEFPEVRDGRLLHDGAAKMGNGMETRPVPAHRAEVEHRNDLARSPPHPPDLPTTVWDSIVEGRLRPQDG